MRPQIHRDVVFDPATEYHILHSHEGREIAIVTPLKRPTDGQGKQLFHSSIHPDVRGCLKGRLVLLNGPSIVAEVIPITKEVSKLLQNARKK